MKKLYLACYFNEMENENDADVLVIDDEKNPHDAFKVFFKKTYDHDIKNEHIIDLYLVNEVFDKQGGKYRIDLTKD